MKIGILTFHRANNYGAVLQCYALQEVIRSMGHDVEVIDYRQHYIDSLYAPEFKMNKLFSLLFHFRLRGLKKYICKYYMMKRRSACFQPFRKKYLTLSEQCDACDIPKKFDRYIIGSDQMWGLHCTGGYDSVYWGDFERPAGSKLYGYAISSNLKFHESLSDEQIVSAVKNFDGLSFREPSLCDDIFRTTGVNCVVSLDPTLLTDSMLWQPILNNSWSSKRIVALYLLRCNSSSRAAILKKAKSYAKANHCQIVDLTKMKLPVEDFVSVIKYAQCVFTTSFHATVFSIIFKKSFFSFLLHDGHDGRYVELLRMLHLDHHLLDVESELTLTCADNEHLVESSFLAMRQPSFSYLENILE